MFECIAREECPCTNIERVCGLRSGRPILRSYHAEEHEGQREECYLQHVILCYKEWKKRRKVFIKPIINRVTSIVFAGNEPAPNVSRDLAADIETGLKIAIIHHDLGKLTKEYQEGKWYRHEIVGAYLTYNILSEYLTDEKPYGKILRSLLSAAVYLHHEAIQLARRWSGLRSPTFEYLLNTIGPLSFTFEETAYSFFKYANTIGELGLRYELPGEIKGKEIVNIIGNFVCLIDGMPYVSATRLCLASILLLITEIDNKAAERGRVML